MIEDIKKAIENAEQGEYCDNFDKVVDALWTAAWNTWVLPEVEALKAQAEPLLETYRNNE